MSDINQTDLERHKASILQSANEHYGRSHQPVLLSRIGADFSKDFGQFKTLYNPVTLTAFIKEHLSKELKFAEGRLTGPAAAVEPAPVIDQQINFPHRNFPPRFPHEGLQNYPGSLVIAFCLKPSEDTDVYFSIQPPFRYTEIPARDPAPGPNYRIIERDVRLGKRSADLTSEDMALLSNRIAKWITKNEMDNVFKQGGRPSRSVAPSIVSVGTNALRRFLAAQAPEIRDKLMIPGDIAELLSRHD